MAFTHSAMVIHGIKALLVSSTAIGSFNIIYDMQLCWLLYKEKNTSYGGLIFYQEVNEEIAQLKSI